MRMKGLQMKSPIKLVVLSDTHGHHRSVEIPDGDVLVFAGDFMTSGYKHQEVKDFGKWFSNQPHRYKILVSGNHDRMVESFPQYCLEKFSKNVIYLQDSGCEINGWNFWGSPFQPEFNNWAFNVPRGTLIRKHWDLIPNDTDILITHGPPYGVLDQINTPRSKYFTEGHLGCEELSKVVNNISPIVHIFGHIHGGYGQLITCYGEDNYSAFYNASICNEEYKPVNKPHVIELE